MVTHRHANILINTGGATAADVRALIAHIQEVGRGADRLPAGGGDRVRGGVLSTRKYPVIDRTQSGVSQTVE